MEAPAEALFLDGHGMAALPESLRGNTRLRHLDLRANRLSALPAWLAELPALESLSIGGNPLPGVPPEVTALARLRHLYVHELALESVPAALGDLVELRTLDLGHNRLATLPAELGRLTALETLYLADNRLAELPERDPAAALAALPRRHRQRPHRVADMDRRARAAGRAAALPQLARRRCRRRSGACDGCASCTCTTTGSRRCPRRSAG